MNSSLPAWAAVGLAQTTLRHDVLRERGVEPGHGVLWSVLAMGHRRRASDLGLWAGCVV